MTTKPLLSLAETFSNHDTAKVKNEAVAVLDYLSSIAFLKFRITP